MVIYNFFGSHLKEKIVLLLFILFSVRAFAQTFTSSSATITQGYSVTEVPVQVNGLVPATINNTFGLKEVCINVNFSSTYDLTIYIVSPAGIATKLVDRLYQGGGDFSGTCFSMSASNYIALSAYPFSGQYKPQQGFGQHNNGQNANGIWKLRVANRSTFYTGIVNSCSITFGTSPAPNPVMNLSSNLPLVYINTTAAIVDEPKTMASIAIIDNGVNQQNHPGDVPAFSSKIGVEIRGASSKDQPKLCYGFETWDAAGNEVKTSFLNFPEESDWVLIANYADATLMRNYITYELHRRTGHYAPRMRLCELYIDSTYQGVYLIGESIRRDKNRVNIAKLKTTDIAGDDLTGGYIFKRDGPSSSECGGWNSNYGPYVYPTGSMYWLYQYPCANIQPEQQQYLASHIDLFEGALMGTAFTNPSTGYLPYIDLKSFVDFMVMSELVKSIDGYRKSCYFYKEKDSKGGKIFSGPMWDYDLSWGFPWDRCFINDSSGWNFQIQSSFNCYPSEMPIWYNRLMEDTSGYINALNCRWFQLRQSVLSTTAMQNFIDSTATLLAAAQQRNFMTWPTLYNNTTFNKEVANVRNWAKVRSEWIDANMPGACVPTAENSKSQKVGLQALQIMPNPATKILTITPVKSFTTTSWNIRILDAAGREIRNEKITSSKHELNVEEWSNGLYAIIAEIDGENYLSKLVVVH